MLPGNSYLRFLEPEFVLLHIDASAAEGDAFHLQTESLLGSTFSGELDGTARADDALPGQAGNLTKNAYDLAGSSRPACGSGDGSVGGDGSFGQRANSGDDSGAEIGSESFLSD